MDQQFQPAPQTNPGVNAPSSVVPLQPISAQNPPQPGVNQAQTPVQPVQPTVQSAPLKPLEPTKPPVPPSTPQTPQNTPKAAKPPGLGVIPIIIGIVVLVLLGLGGWAVWRAIGPQSKSNLPGNPNPTSMPLPTDEDPTGVACTMDAMQCPDGSFVGRTGPNCEFVCPDGDTTTNDTTKGGMTLDSTNTSMGMGGSGTSGSLGGTTAGMNPSVPSTTNTASWDTYRNPVYNVTFKFPQGWEVRDQKPYPRSDIQFRHAFGPIQNFQARGYLEVSTLPVLELIEQLKTDGSTITEMPDATLGTRTVVKRTATKGTTTVEHWFIRVGERTYHITATGSTPEVAQIAQTLQIQ